MDIENEKIKRNQWVEENPLRQWRKKKAVTLAFLGSMIEVGYHTVHDWETGAGMPNDNQLLLLSKIMNFKNLKKELQEWKKRKPTL